MVGGDTQGGFEKSGTADERPASASRGEDCLSASRDGAQAVQREFRSPADASEGAAFRSGAASGIDCLAGASPSPAEPKEPEAQPKKKAAPIISFADLMNDDEIEITPALEQQDTPVPENDVLEQKWKEVAQGVSDSRLVNALVNAKLEITEIDGVKQVAFYVMNDAQKNWIDTKHRSELESRYRQLVGSQKIKLEVVVTPAEEVEAKPYMPEDKVRDLMGKNENVKEFIADLGLNI